MPPTITTTVTAEFGSSLRPPSSKAAEYAADFQSLRPRLFGIAYQMLGRAADAEDVVQDVWVRWQGTDRAAVRDRIAFLVTITTRVTLNVVSSARVRREVPVDHWLPDQLVLAEDPAQASERSVDLERALALLLERLSPTERAVFVLREAFDYSFRDIADRLTISEANARQLGHRARVHLTESRTEPVGSAARDRLLRTFVDAAHDGAMAHLERVLAEDIAAEPHRGRRQRGSQKQPALAASR